MRTLMPMWLLPTSLSRPNPTLVGAGGVAGALWTYCIAALLTWSLGCAVQDWQHSFRALEGWALLVHTLL